MDDELSATDILMFDMKAAQLAYLLNKRKQRKASGLVVDVQAEALKMWEPAPFSPFDPNLPMFLRRQAD